MLEGGFMFSNAQALSTLNSTGVVSTNVFDMELAASGGATILENDQIDAFFNVLITATTNTGSTEGIDVQLRSSDNSDMTTGAIVLATIHISLAEAVAGCKRSIKVLKSLTQKYVGAWFKATSTSLDNATAVDCWMDMGPVGPNDEIQKVPS